MRLIIILFTLALTACQSMPTKQQTEAASYGPMPTDHKAIITASLSVILKDPDSAKINNITPPRKEWFLNPADFNTEFDYAWLSCATINAKNSFGGYTGSKQYVFFIKHNKVIFYQSDQLNSGRMIRC